MSDRRLLPALAAAAAFAAASPLLAANADTGPTYTKDVAPLLAQSCVACHRPNQIGPMSLLSYDEVRPWAKSIAKNVEDHRMPPWHADPSIGHFANDRSLDQAQIDTIVRWVQNGAPEGDPADLTVKPSFPDDEWLLGEPDLVVELERVSVPGGNQDLFPKLIGRVMLPEDRWIKAVEIRPGNRKVLHHVIAFQIKGFEEPDLQGGWLGAWAAGTDPMVFPEGTGRLLQKGANILADMHYHPTETDQTDVTRIGFHFADGPVAKELVNIWVQNDGFEIPAGAKDHEVVSTYRFWQSGKIMGLIPHMHYRGKDFKFTATYPDGRQQVLLNVPRWDFNWQTNYQLAQPIEVPAGTRVECVAHYDNSADNPVNPDPSKNVKFGPESYDEMMIGFVDFIADEGVRLKEPQAIRTEMLRQLGREHPGEVYAVHAGRPEFTAPLHLPRQGDGVFYVIFDGQLLDARVRDIQWDGSSFTAKVDGPNGQEIPLSGKLGEQGTIETTLGERPFNGAVYPSSPQAASGR
jgi:mono/diheme cytochrome c family protein